MGLILTSTDMICGMPLMKDTILNGNWECKLFDEDIAKKFDFDFLMPTKLIPEEIVPVRIVGKMVLESYC